MAPAANQRQQLRTTNGRDADHYACRATAQMVRLIRHVASTGKVRVLMTSLLDPLTFPCAEFGGRYHQRWRIEEAFKRLEHRLNLEHVSGLSQQAALHDFAAKAVCDNLQSLTTETPLREASLLPTRRINRAAAHSILTGANASVANRGLTARGQTPNPRIFDYARFCIIVSGGVRPRAAATSC